MKKLELTDLYFRQGKSMKDISKIFRCSLSTIRYWMNKYEIKRRSISEAIYLQNNPNGDPFRFRQPKNIEEAILYGMGLGLYWGE